MSNFRPASMDDDDDENEDNPLLGRIPYENLRQYSGIRELLAPFLGARLQSATIMLLLGFGRLKRFVSELLIDTRELLRQLKTWIRANPKHFTAICIGVILFALACATPAILGAIGFSSIGPVAGSIAAGWQASMGTVIAGSLFSFLQSAAMGGAAIGLFAGIGTVGGLVALIGVGVSANVVRERMIIIGEMVGEKFAEAGEVMKNQAVQVGGAVANVAVHVGQVVRDWWGKATRKMKGE